jgi:hypothetical protein
MIQIMKCLARRVAAVCAECAAAQRRMDALRVATDRYEPEPDRAPDTYPQFLWRTSGPLLREPSAIARRKKPGP